MENAEQEPLSDTEDAEQELLDYWQTPLYSETEKRAYTYKIWEDALRLMNEGQLPPEDEDYGPWARIMNRLRNGFENGGTEEVEQELKTMLYTEETYGYGCLFPYQAVTPDGQSWREALEARQAERQAEQARQQRWEALLDKAMKQDKDQRSTLKLRAQWRREDEQRRAYGWRQEKPEKDENWLPMREWTISQLAWKIYDYLEEEDSSRTQILDHFSHGVSSERLTDALEYLEGQEMAWRKRVPTAGRPREVWSTWFGEDEQPS